jgi:hypothetical protein
LYNVRGKVDRVDAYNDRIRIIDYKTGEIKTSATQFYVGKKLQLYLYMNAFLTNGYKPAGAYYSPINNEFSSNETKEPALQGRTVDIEEIIHATDPQASIDKHSDIVNMYRTDGKLNKGGALLSEKEFYDYLRAGNRITTSQISNATCAKTFEKYLEQGYDILSISCTGALSSTVNVCYQTRDLLKEKYPDSKIICIDGCISSAGLGILCIRASELRAQGKTIEETAQWVEENKKFINF